MINSPEYTRVRIKPAAFVAALFFLSTAIPLLGAEGEETEEALEYSRGVKQCMTCHREGRDMPAHEIFFSPMGITGDPDAPFAEGNHDCEACHGPSKHHLRRQSDGSRLPPSVTFNEKTPI